MLACALGSLIVPHAYINRSMGGLMNYRKQGLKALGLSFLAVLGLMAFAASAVQASGKVTVPGLVGTFTVGVGGEAHNALASDSKLFILNLNMEIFCHTASVPEGLLESTGTGEVEILFESCLAQGVSGGNLSGSVCQLKHITARALALIILHSGNTKLTLNGSGGQEHKTGTGSPYILFTPALKKEKLNFAVVVNETECALPEVANVKGCVVAKFNTSGSQVTHLISTKGLLDLFGCTLNYGANIGHLDVDALVRLNNVHGSHAGLAWSVE